MISLLTTIVSFLVAIAVLVTVHEFGHFWVARRLGVKVVRFSIGFGRPILTWHRRGDETEYSVGAIPLGGYVKMVDEREEAVAPRDLPYAFNRQRLWKRAAIVAAGPLFNFLFAFVAYWGILVTGESGMRPQVGEVLPGSVAAEAGFRIGDELLAIGSRQTPSWGSAWPALVSGALDGDDLVVRVRESDGREVERILPGEALAALDPGSGLLDALGLSSARPSLPPVIGEVLDGSPAQRAGLRSGDAIVAVDGTSLTTWHDLVDAVRMRPGQRVELQVERGADSLSVLLLTESVAEGEGRIGRIGAGPLVPDGLLDPYRVEVRYGPLAAAAAAAERIADVSVLTLRIIGRMLTGQASVENLSSPIGIADTAGKTASFGVEPFIKFLAMLSVSLGLLNLLPIPVLDGGHLLYFAIEAVIGRPLPDRVQAQGFKIGVALLVSLMTLAFYVDIARLLG